MWVGKRQNKQAKNKKEILMTRSGGDDKTCAKISDYTSSQKPRVRQNVKFVTPYTYLAT